MNIQELRVQAYRTAREHGFHELDAYCFNDAHHHKCLIISELMEAVNADRKGLHADMEAFEKYEGRITFEENFERHIKDTVEDELADACLRILDLASCKNIFLECEVTTHTLQGFLLTEKMYNIIHVLVGCEPLNRCLGISFASICHLAEREDVDIKRHIELKMRYNQSRPRLHGKKY